MTAVEPGPSQDTRTFGDRYFLPLALLPAALVLILVGVVPLLYAGWLSLHEYNLVRPPQLFIGLENYAELLSDGRFQYSLRSRGDFDVSELAKKHGGGGHKGAAGFVVDELVHL